MTNDFVLTHNKSLQIYFCVKHQAKNDFLKDVESTVMFRQFEGTEISSSTLVEKETFIYFSSSSMLPW